MEAAARVALLLDALNEVIDARLEEHGLLEPTPTEAPAAAAKPAKPLKPGKGKGKAPTHTLDECKTQLVALVTAQDKQAAIDALSRFGCKKLPDLRPDQVDEFYDYVTGLLESGDDPADSSGGDGDDLFGS
jgi:hypothetical protein